jgi:hypothetical protein
MGISMVVTLQASQDTVIAFDTTSGFQRQSINGETEIWAVSIDTLIPTRRMLESAGEPPIYLTSHSEVVAGSRTTLLLAQPPDPNLRVYVGDTQLHEAESADWRAAYTLGDASGEIRFGYSIRFIWLALVQLGVLGLLIIFAIPPLSERTDPDEEAPARMRSSR